MPEIRARLAAYEPKLADTSADGQSLAAVSLVFLAQGGGPAELLFIERALREGDPWSGHMAFPGGRRDRADADLVATSLRETREEVGLELGRPIARLDD